MRATLHATLALALTAGCGGDPARGPERPPDVLLITIDTLRADHVSCYGYGRETTPNLDALAAEGLVFTHAQAPRAKTTPTVVSLLTGLYPHDHDVRDLSAPASADLVLLPEDLAAGGGYRTGAIVGNWVLTDERSGLARGFDVYVDDLPGAIGVPPNDVPQRTARSVTDGALCALGLGPPSADGASPAAPVAADGEPLFLWLHYMDPHGTYDPPEEHRVFSSAPEPARPGDPARLARYNVPREALRTDGSIDAALVRDLYDGEIRYVDAEIGRLVGALRAAGRLEDTLVVVTADHGESLGEHDYWFEHGRYAYEVTCRVPLIVRFPDGARDRPTPGVRASDVSLTDLYLTLFDWLGLDGARPVGTPPMGEARSQLSKGEDALPHPVFCEKVERADVAGAVQIKAVRIGDWKLLRRYAHRPDPERPAEREWVVLSEELYDTGSDFAEARDLAAAPPAGAPVDELREALLGFIAADASFPELGEILRRRREALEANDPEALERLRALGY